MLILYIIAYCKRDFHIEYAHIFIILGGFITYLASMFALNITVQKNDLTKKSTNAILLYAFLTAIIPNSLTNPTILFSNLFLILGIRSILNLKTGKQIKATILDASLCIGLASLTYFWSITYMMILFLGILYFEPKNYRNWIIPIVGVMTIYLFVNCFTLLFYDSFFEITSHIDTFSFSFENYFNKYRLFAIGIFAICTVFFTSVYVLKFKRKSKKTKPVLHLTIAQLLVALTIVLIAPEKDTSEMIFMASPLAIIGTTYLELSHNDLVKEINIWVFLLLPFMAILF